MSLSRPHRYLSTLVGFWLVVAVAALSPSLHAQTHGATAPVLTGGALEALDALVVLRKGLHDDIRSLKEQLAAAATEAEKGSLRKQLEKLDADLRAVDRNFNDIAAGIDISSLYADEVQEFNLQNELMNLLKPAIDELKEMTSRVRQKSDLKDKIANLEPRVPLLETALKNIDRLLAGDIDEATGERLRATAQSWRKQLSLMRSQLRAAQLQLDKLIAAETSLTEASQNYLKSFFEKRGLYLTTALLVILGIALLSRISRVGMQRFLPGFRQPHRSFQIRLIELLHRVLTALLMIVGPMVVFYIAEDWVLFSLGILLLLGVVLALRQAVPRYWHQVQIFLNIGSVREGERILMDGLPWLVKQINVFSTLVNPVAELSQRVPIDDLVDLKSRPAVHSEPWFPCRRGDWVILQNGLRGKVIGIAPEMVQLVERGGAVLTYQMADFLANSPRNLATDFRLKEVIGISYKLQKDATTVIPETLRQYLEQRIGQEGYGDRLVNLRVEFASAGESSLELVVIADFKGELGDLYNRLRRAIQRWCVDACSEFGWEIPFPQLTLHGTVAGKP